MAPSVTVTHEGDMLFKSKIGEHTISIDVPDSMGGKNRAPLPPDLFVVSLASCVNAFVTNYLKNNGHETEGVEVELTFDVEENPKRFLNLEAHIRVPSAACAKKEKAILKVAEHCPVHATMTCFQGMKLNFECPEE